MRQFIVLIITAAWAWAAESTSGRIDLNNAPREALERLPGVGPKLAEEILRGRPYRAIDELDRVKGIGAKRLEQIRPKVFILPMQSAAMIPRRTNGVEKININAASKEELERLPGIGPKKAEAIIGKRPFRRPDDLMKVDGIKRAQFDKIKEHIRVR